MTDRYPHMPGSYSHAPETSREAAAHIAPVASSIRARVLAIVVEAGEQGAIGDEVAQRLGLNVYQVRSRLSELHADGKIADSGRRRIGASGRRGAVWVLPEFAPVPQVTGGADGEYAG